MLPQNTLLWHIGYFELNAIEKQQVQEEPFALPFLPKNHFSRLLFQGEESNPYHQRGRASTKMSLHKQTLLR